MIKLNDYLYSGDTVLKIIHNYTADLREDALMTNNQIDLLHCDFLDQITNLLEHNDFLTSQSQRIREFYKYMVANYPFLAFTFKGRIKSLVRAEAKFNGNIVEYIYDYYLKNEKYPSIMELKNRLTTFRDLIAYRIVISLPKCHLKEGESRKEREIEYLYEIANQLPQFLKQYGFRAEIAGLERENESLKLDRNAAPYYRDYIINPGENDYRSLHVTFFDEISRCYVEVQLRTKDMDDNAEIGNANHIRYEEHQRTERSRRDLIPEKANEIFDEAYERVFELQGLELSSLDVNMFSARDNYMINDGCGLFRGRQILPYEHLSRFQNDLMD